MHIPDNSNGPESSHDRKSMDHAKALLNDRLNGLKTAPCRHDDEPEQLLKLTLVFTRIANQVHDSLRRVRTGELNTATRKVPDHIAGEVDMPLASGALLYRDVNQLAQAMLDTELKDQAFTVNTEQIKLEDLETLARVFRETATELALAATKPPIIKSKEDELRDAAASLNKRYKAEGDVSLRFNDLFMRKVIEVRELIAELLEHGLNQGPARRLIENHTPEEA